MSRSTLQANPGRLSDTALNAPQPLFPNFQGSHIYYKAYAALEREEWRRRLGGLGLTVYDRDIDATKIKSYKTQEQDSVKRKRLPKLWVPFRGSV